MNDPLIREDLPPGWIDLSIGEARSVRNNFESIYGKCYNIVNYHNDLIDYQHPCGYLPLVKILEERHNAKVIITCGAKQALCASFYALNNEGRMTLGIKVPYWSQMPQAVKSEGIKLVGIDDLLKIYWRRDKSPFDCYLSVSPNNPDGSIENTRFISSLKEANIPIIHDAVYNTKTYTYCMQNISSDIEIYSFSKMFGLSGLRVGYCVVHNTDYYNDILSYIETKTVGVSSISQGIIYDILTRDKDIEKNFYIKSANDIRECFSKFDKIKDLLEPRHSHNGMFGWFVNKGNVDFDSLKIKVLDGKYFGSPGHVRINMAAGIDTIDKVIDIIERSRNEQI